MSWAKFDDRTPSNPKIMLLSDSAFRLWFSSVCHSCEHLTDGFIATDIPGVLPKAPVGARLKKAISELVERGAWDPVDGGWEVHDFLDWNPTAEKVKLKRRARSEAGRRGGKNSGKVRSKNEANASANGKQTESKNEPRPRPRTQDPPIVPQGTDEVNSLQAWAAKLLRNPTDASFDVPNQKPEVIQAASVIHEGLGFAGRPRLGGIKDPGTRAILELFSAGFTIEDLEKAASGLREHEFTKKVRKIQAVVPSVVRDILDNPKASNEEIWE